MKKFTLSFLLITFVLSFSAMGQDVLYFKNHKQKKVTLVEVGPKLIKYQLGEKTPVFSVKNYRLKKIVFADGTTDLLGNENPRKDRPFGVSAGVDLGINEESGMLFTTFDYFILPQIDLQLSLGADDLPFESFNGFYSFGADFHLNKSGSKKLITPFTGLHFGSDNNSLFGFAQIPLGAALQLKSGFTTSVALNWWFYGAIQNPLMNFQAKIGWHF